MWAAEDSLMSLHEVGKKTKLKKKLKKTSLAVTSRRIVGSYPGKYSGGLCRRSNRPPSSTLYRITFWVEAIHSFLTFTVGTPPPQPPNTLPSQRPLGSQSALRPHQPLWKNPVHLTCIDWLHLCVLFGPCRWRRRAGQLPAAAPRPI